jgi:hypothetical protein
VPNNVYNKIIITDIDDDTILKILSKIYDDKNERVDFNILIPRPLNIWQGSVSSDHEKSFNDNGLNWNRRNWGTKWNAYESSILRGSDNLVIKFETAWNTPRDWIVAILNYFKISFKVIWQDEGDDCVWIEYFKHESGTFKSNEWVQEKGSKELYREVYNERWGEYPED